MKTITLLIIRVNENISTTAISYSAYYALNLSNVLLYHFSKNIFTIVDMITSHNFFLLILTNDMLHPKI